MFYDTKIMILQFYDKKVIIKYPYLLMKGSFLQ